MPDEMAEWRAIITRYSLNILADYATWIGVIQFLNAQNVPIPPQLAEVSYETANRLTGIPPLGALWGRCGRQFALNTLLPMGYPPYAPIPLQRFPPSGSP